jgi:hypothetical protein
MKREICECKTCNIVLFDIIRPDAILYLGDLWVIMDSHIEAGHDVQRRTVET